MPAPFQSYSFAPKDGGKLITSASAGYAGVANYVEKRDFRRILDQEAVREGYDYFWGNYAKAIGTQPFPDPSGDPITLIHLSRRPNGKTAIIAGNKTKLWRYYSLEDARYVLGDDDGIYVEGDGDGPYFEENPGEWILIGSGFSEDGHRWEAVDLNGYTIFNNGVDLPQLFRLEWSAVRPHYELREQGIASVGTIASYGDFLMMADIKEISSTKLQALMALQRPATPTATASQASSSHTVVASVASFTADMVGYRIVWDSGETRKITAFTDSTHVTVSSGISVPSGLFKLENPAAYGVYTGAYSSEIQYRMIWSLPDNPQRVQPSFIGTIRSGGNQIVLSYPAKSLTVGQQLDIAGAGVNGGTLQAKITHISQAGQLITLDKTAAIAVTGAIVVSSDTINSVLGYIDLQSDGSGILRMLELVNTLVVYKDTSIFLVDYTGIVATPFNVREIKVREGATLHYRWTLCAIDGRQHVFAGRNSFFTFDLVNRNSEESELSELCANVFFDQATLDNTESIYAADNSITKEITFYFPSETDDHGLVLDYRLKTFATTAMAPTAAATVKRPESSLAVGATEDWHLLGFANGTLCLYGLVSKALPQWSGAKEIFTRRSANPFTETLSPYNAYLRSGATAFGDPFNERDVSAYVLYLASQQIVEDPNVTSQASIEFLGGVNESVALTVLGVRVLTHPAARNMIPVWFRQQVFADRITATGPMRISGRTWNVSPVRGESLPRV